MQAQLISDRLHPAVTHTALSAPLMRTRSGTVYLRAPGATPVDPLTSSVRVRRILNGSRWCWFCVGTLLRGASSAPDPPAARWNSPAAGALIG